ncbi:MAG: amidohydrolase family protein [Streptosporangiaceae bacterium]
MPADVVFRVGRAYGMTADRGVYQAVAVKDGRIAVAVANSAALRMAGITATSADPPSGTVVRLADGTPAGVLIEAGALDPVRRLLHRLTTCRRGSPR